MAQKNSLLEDHLKQILGSDVSSDIISYVSSIRTLEDLDEFMENIIDRKSSVHLKAYEAIQNILLTNSKRKNRKKYTKIQQFQEINKNRKSCGCDGQIHEVYTNCLGCGRIYCVEENKGPCFFCQDLVDTSGEIPAKIAPKATENKVYDDDKDYFKVQNTNEEKYDHRRMVITLDFASRKIIESTDQDEEIKRKLREDIKRHLDNVNKLYKKLQITISADPTTNNNSLIDLLIQMRHRKPATNSVIEPESSDPQIMNYGTVVYDEELISNTDYGMCLSLHQPYASLLVAGVKRHEGRMWSTNHRGRLWIAAASKVPNDNEIEQLEQFFRHYYNEPLMRFPREYPTSCLLGCVYVENCLPQSEYQKRFPNGESLESAYVLICSQPVILPIFYPIVGQHKIYRLETELHNCAKLSLRHAVYSLD